MNTADLRTCLLLSETLHFGEAARLANLSQPAVSQAVRRVERSFGVDLFDRGSGRVTVTAIGRRLLPRIEALVAQERTIASIAAEEANRAQSMIRVGYAPWLRGSIRAAFAAVAEAGVAVPVQLVLMPWRDQATRLQDGSLDLACLPIGRVPRDARSVPLQRFRLDVLCRSRTASATGDGTLLMPDLRDLCVVPLPEDSDLRRTGQAAIERVVHESCPERLFDQLLTGDATALLDSALLPPELRRSLLVTRLMRPVLDVEFVLACDAKAQERLDLRTVLGAADARMPREQSPDGAPA